MTVKAEVTSTLNGQSAEIIVMEKPPRGELSYQKKTLNGGTETLIFEDLDGGRDKEYKAKIVPSTDDVTQTAEVNYGAEIDIDPIPHRDAEASQHIREDRNFNQGIGAKELGLGNHSLIGGLMTTALRDGEVLADDGYVYSTIQAAQDAASSWIFIGPGKFNESVTVDTEGLTVKGTGYSSHIDSSDDAVSVSSQNVSIGDLRVTATNKGVETLSSNTTFSNIFIDAGSSGFRIDAPDTTVHSSTVNSAGSKGISISGGNSPRAVIDNVTILSTESDDGMGNFEDSIICNCLIQDAGDDGVRVLNDCVLIGNRIANSSRIGIVTGQSGNIAANNRVSDSSNNDLYDSGSNNTFDGNLTGSAN